MATLGLNFTLPIYKADGTSFHGLELEKFAVDSVVMSLGDKITGDVYYPDNTLDVTMKEYVLYDGVRYLLVNPPTIVKEATVKDNSELKGMTKYSFEFYHPMYMLANFPFTDAAVSDDEKMYLSEKRTFSWIGYPSDYVAKLNKNLSGTEWHVVMSDRFPVDKAVMLSGVLQFEDNTIAEAIKRGYEVWGVPYVIDTVKPDTQLWRDGKRFIVQFGLPTEEITVDGRPFVFRFGQDVGLKNNSRTPRKNKIVTRLAGYGSEDNIPYGYPQIVWDGDEDDPRLQYPLYDGIVGGRYVKLIHHPFTRSHLMPSVYTESVNRKVNPNAEDYDPDLELVDYYDAVGSDFPNPINPVSPSYESHEFDVKPEMDDGQSNVEILGAVPLNPDLTEADEWDDTMDEDGNYLQSYFKVTLPVMSFDIYACAAITQEMEINMRSGACLGCTFPVQVDWDDYKLSFYDEDGNFAPDGEQRDLEKFPKSNEGSIDVILKKENTTFGTLMPNIYQVPQEGDEFVVLGISLPLEYIQNAEKRLDDEMLAYMLENNVYYFDYPLKFSEHFLATHTNILSQIKPNVIIRFEFADEEMELFVKQLTIKYGSSVLPQYDITLTDNIEVVLNQIGQVASDVEHLSSLLALLRQFYRGGLGDMSTKLSRIYDDTAQGTIGFLKGAWFGSKKWYIDEDGSANFFNTTVNGLLKAYNAMINNVRSTNYSGDGMMDSGWRITNEYEGYNSKATFDFLYIRKKAIFEELEIRKLSHIGGNFCLSGASGRVWKVDYYDGDGNILGYDTYTVPWTLANRIMILFRPHNALNRYLGKRKQIQRRLTEAERQRVARVRCYMFNDDGTTETMGNWTVGAQARCQTFNVEKQMEFDGSSWTGTKVGNTYWYRLVTAVGESTLEDGKKHEYVEFSIDQTKEGTAYEWADALSDLPSKGDVFVQMGHRTRQDQSNVIMLETANDDSPAIKMYAGVNWWTTTGKLVAVMSPSGWRVVSNKFEWITEYGERFRPQVNRGVWVLIPLEDGVRKCYYNDMVSHNGSYWRCIVADGSYTTDEPSESSSAWSKEVYAGIAPYLSISQQMIAVPCEKDGKASEAFSRTITVKLMVTNLEATISSVTLSGADAHVTKSGNNIAISFAAGANVTNKDYAITVEGDLDGNHYIATDKISVYAVIRGNDAYEVNVTPEVMIWSQQEESPYSINIDGNSTGNSSVKVSVTNDGVAQPFQITNVVVNGKNASGQSTRVVATYDNNSGRVWVTSIANDTITGEILITLTYGNNASRTVSVQFYCNLIGTWREKVVGDTKEEIANKMTFDICDETGAVVATETLANYIKSSSRQEATLTRTTTSQGQSITAMNQRISTAEGNINTISDGLGNTYTKQETANLVNQSVQSATQGMVTTSNFQQTASSFSLITETDATTIAQNKATAAENDVISRLSQTGIKIDGSNRSITLIGGKIYFKKSDGTTDANISFDTSLDLYKIGGFIISSWGIGTNKSWAGATGDNNIYLSNDGRIWARYDNGTALHVAGGSELYGKLDVEHGDTYIGTTTSSIEMIAGSNTGITLGVKGNTNVLSVNNGAITVSGTSNLSGNVNAGTSSSVIKLSGKVRVPDSLIVGSGTYTLPSSPEDGQFVFVKGSTGQKTVSGGSKQIVQADRAASESVSSVNIGYTASIFIYSSTVGKWLQFNCQ